MGKWSKCFACKNVSGIRIRQVVCIRESPKPGAEDILVEDNKCEGVKPATKEMCVSPNKCRSSRFIDNIPKYLLKDVWKQLESKIVKREVVSYVTFGYYRCVCKLNNKIGRRPLLLLKIILFQLR